MAIQLPQSQQTHALRKSWPCLRHGPYSHHDVIGYTQRLQLLAVFLHGIAGLRRWPSSYHYVTRHTQRGCSVKLCFCTVWQGCKAAVAGVASSYKSYLTHAFRITKATKLARSVRAGHACDTDHPTTTTLPNPRPRKSWPRLRHRPSSHHDVIGYTQQSCSFRRCVCRV